MREKSIMALVGVVTMLLITITLVDVIGGIGDMKVDTAENNTETTSNVADNDNVINSENQEDSSNNGQNNGQNNGNVSSDGNTNSDENINNSETSIINPEGLTLASRIFPPVGYVRTEETANGIATFLRDYVMKEDGAKLLIYDGTVREKQDAHIAVFTLPLESRDLQQASDSVMRMYAEYFLATGQSEKIGFHYSDGFLASYSKWIQGYRIKVTDSVAKWIEDSKCDNSYESFQEYMRLVFAYAGVYSMKGESTVVELSDMQVGDVLLQSGTNGHVVMIVDACVDADGKKAFLLAQGGKPAQEFHVLKNPLHEEDPWYYEDELVYPIETPEYTFEEGTLRRLNY